MSKCLTRLLVCLAIFLIVIVIPVVSLLSLLKVISEMWASAISSFSGYWGCIAAIVAIPRVHELLRNVLIGTTRPRPPAPPRPRVRKRRLPLVVLASLLLLLVPPIGIWTFVLPHNACDTLPELYVSPYDAKAALFPASDGLNTATSTNNTCIGISDGLIAFDWDTKDRPANYISLKSQMIEKLRAGDLQGAKQLFRTTNAPNDAEMQIYLQDQEITQANLAPSGYITLVAAVAMDGRYGGGSRDILQGVSVTQSEYNQGCHLTNCLKVRILIANTSDDPDDATRVANRIANLAKADKTILGVIGWPLSQQSINAVNVLSNAHLPMVSPTSSASSLRGPSSFFFSIAPSNSREALIDVQYARQDLHAQKIVVFEDPHNDYSKSLAESFSTNNPAVIDTETYEVGMPDSIQKGWRHMQAQHYQPDLIFFAGYAKDLSTLLTLLPVCNPTGSTCLQVLGGDALYVVGDYTPQMLSNFSRLHFTAFAYPDMWPIAHLGKDQPAFFREYPQEFDDKQFHASPYGYTRPDGDATLAYDATQTLINGYKNARLATGNPTADDVQKGLTHIDEAHPLQGASGRIAFGPDNSSDGNKTIVFLYVDTNRNIHECSYDGQLLATGQTPPSIDVCGPAS